MLTSASQPWTLFEAAHLLRRAGFGGSPETIRRFHQLGREKAVEHLLLPSEPLDATPFPSWANQETAIAESRERASKLIELRRESRNLSPEEADRKRREFNNSFQRQSRQRGIEAQGWWFRRMLTTDAPLREKMVLFWHDHFATSLQKVRQPALMIQQNELFRHHAVGSFKTLTQAIIRDPAMMLYLDSQNSRKGKPNENLARELMELFTLGEGHYSEHDIKEAARALTGYQINRLTGKVSHNRRQWDSGPKTIFGKTSAYDGDGVVDLIFSSSQASRYLPQKLWTYFVADNPSATTVEALATTFRQNDFQIAPVLREIFLSKDFYAKAHQREQIKCPIQYLLQMLKELDLRDAPHGYIVDALQQLGQSPFLPPNVAGWDWGRAWINTNTLLTRYNIAGFITKGASNASHITPKSPGENHDDSMMAESMQPTQADPKANLRRRAMQNAQQRWHGPDYEKIAPRPLREDPAKLVDALMFRFFQDPLTDKQRETFLEYARSKKGAVFTNHEVAELCHLMLSTPYYQLA